MLSISLAMRTEGQYIWVKHTVRQTAIVQLDTDVKAGDPWPPKLSLTHADVHLLMSANQ